MTNVKFYTTLQQHILMAVGGVLTSLAHLLIYDKNEPNIKSKTIAGVILTITAIRFFLAIVLWGVDINVKSTVTVVGIIIVIMLWRSNYSKNLNKVKTATVEKEK